MKNKWLWLATAIIAIISILILFKPLKFSNSGEIASLTLPTSRFALLVGINDRYPWANKDIRLMSDVLKVKQGEPNFFVSSDSVECAKSNIKNRILQFADLAKSGDIVYLYFTCHGKQIFDQNEDEKKYDPKDEKDEVMLLYNQETIVDDEMDSLLCLFDPGVQIVFMADCCHSGSMHGIEKTIDNFSIAPSFVDSNMDAELIYLGACQDTYLAKTINNEVSRFTNAVYKWGKSNINLTFFEVFRKVQVELSNRQKPSYVELCSKGICKTALTNCRYIQESFRNQIAFSK